MTWRPTVSDALVSEDLVRDEGRLLGGILASITPADLPEGPDTAGRARGRH